MVPSDFKQDVMARLLKSFFKLFDGLYLFKSNTLNFLYLIFSHLQRTHFLFVDSGLFTHLSQFLDSHLNLISIDSDSPEIRNAGDKLVKLVH